MLELEKELEKARLQWTKLLKERATWAADVKKVKKLEGRCGRTRDQHHRASQHPLSGVGEEECLLRGEKARVVTEL